MKKILSVVIAVMMMFAVMVPAFAAATTVDVEGPAATNPEDPVGKTVKVETTLDGQTDISADGAYTVTIPADQKIIWGTTSYEALDYSVYAQLKLGAKLKVTVADLTKTADIPTRLRNAGYAGVEGDDGIDYTLTGDIAKEFGEVVGTKDAPVAQDVDITIAAAEWGTVPVATYETLLTYTVEYDANGNFAD